MRRDEATGGRAAVRAGPSSAETGPSGRGTRRWRTAGLGGALGAAFGVAAVAVGLLAAVAAGDGWDAARAADSEALWPMLQTSERMAVPSGFVRIAPGRFVMGSPSDEEGRDDDEVQHSVSVTRPFLLGKTEVTQAEWQGLMGTNPSAHQGGGPAPR
jgi:hypothetical protein